MSESMAVESPKKVRSVRFNDNALETIVSYNTDEVAEYDMCRNNDFDNMHNDDDAVRLYRRSGSHESLYDKLSIESAPMNPRLLKKRSSDLDDSYHCSSSSSSHSYRNAQFDMSMITSSDSNNSSHHPSFMSFSGSSSRSRFGDSDLDISHHNRQQRHYNKRVMCV